MARFISSRRGMQSIILATLCIFIISLFFIGTSIFSMAPDLASKDISPKTEKERATEQKQKKLAQLFSEQNLNSNLTPYINQKMNSPQKRKLLENAFSQGNLHIFEFNSSAHASNPMQALATLIREIDSTQTNLLDIAQAINTSIMQTLKSLSIGSEDLIFAESAIRLYNQSEPYPFIVLQLSKANSERPYFPSKREKAKFISILLKNIKNHDDAEDKSENKRHNTSLLAQKVKIIDEGTFLYITFDNIISHVIRLAPRKEKMQSLTPLKNEHFYFTLIIDDVGENFPLARKFMNLPFPVILSIWPHSTHATSIATIAHEKGLPIFLHQPMEPLPDAGHTPNMGKGGLETSMSKEMMMQTLQQNFLSVPHSRGINNHMGSKFTMDEAAVNTFLLALKNLMPHALILDSLTHNDSVLYSHAKNLGFLTGQRNYFIDNKGDNILNLLNKAYTFAKKTKHVYVIGHARQETLKALLTWKQYLNTDIVFALPSY